MFEKELQEASQVVVALENTIEALEKLVNGKAGFLKEVKKKTADDAIHRLGEDIFVLKMFGRFVKNTVSRICTMCLVPEKPIENEMETKNSLLIERGSEKLSREVYIEEKVETMRFPSKMSNAVWELKKNQLETLLTSIVSELKKENLSEIQRMMIKTIEIFESYPKTFKGKRNMTSEMKNALEKVRAIMMLNAELFASLQAAQDLKEY